MPLYEYQCEKCGEAFEVMQKFTDPPLTTHEACGGPVHRLLSPPALQFKGSGWYITDYAKSSESSENGAGKGDSAKTDSGTGGKETSAKQTSASDSAKPSSSDKK